MSFNHFTRVKILRKANPYLVWFIHLLTHKTISARMQGKQLGGRLPSALDLLKQAATGIHTMGKKLRLDAEVRVNIHGNRQWQRRAKINSRDKIPTDIRDCADGERVLVRLCECAICRVQGE